MSKKCSNCGSLNVEEVFDGEAYCKNCHLHCSVLDFEDASVFDTITQSEETLAPKLVYSVLAEDICTGTKTRYYHSTITGQRYDEESEAVAATVARLKEVKDE